MNILVDSGTVRIEILRAKGAIDPAVFAPLVGRVNAGPFFGCYPGGLLFHGYMPEDLLEGGELWRLDFLRMVQGAGGWSPADFGPLVKIIEDANRETSAVPVVLADKPTIVDGRAP